MVPHHPVGVLDRQRRRHLFALFDGGLAQIQQGGHVEGFLQAVVLGNLAVAPHFRPHFRLVQDGGEVQPFGLPVVDGLLGLQHIGTSHHFVDGAEAELSHPLADFLGDEPHVVDHVVGVAHEVLPQFRVLGRHTHRAVFMWQTRIMMQPRDTRGAVEKPYSSAPSRAAITTSRPVFICPSVSTTTRLRRLFITRV